MAVLLSVLFYQNKKIPFMKKIVAAVTGLDKFG